MDLLIQRKTSKEIARELRISPHTVDQRIALAKEKLGAKTRNEAAVVYQRLSGICQQSIYEAPHIAPDDASAHSGSQVDDPMDGNPNEPLSNEIDRGDEEISDYRVGPELLHGPNGTFWRVALVVAFAFAILLLGLIGIAVFSALSDLMSF